MEALSSHPSHWVHDLDPFILRFPEGFPLLEGVRWYGMAYVLGFVLAYLLLRLYRKQGRIDWNQDQLLNLMTALIIGVAVGGRLGYLLLYNLSDFLSNPLVFFAFSQGGMASHGGFIGVALAMVWFARTYRQSILRTADVLLTVCAPGIFLGRIANFINGELWGKVTDVSWAVVFPQSAPGMPIEYIQPRHPSQLYEAFAEGLLLFLYLQWRFWIRPPRHNGQIAGEFLLFYSVARILCELFREPDASLVLGLSRGTAYSALTAIAGVVLILYARSRPPAPVH